MSTADYLQFGFFSNEIIYADVNQTTILSAGDPTTWGFVDSTGSITVGAAGGLTTNLVGFEDINFIGGDINMTDTNLDASWINLASSTGSGNVDIMNISDWIVLNIAGGDIQLNSTNIYANRSAGFGNVYIRSGQLVMDDSTIDLSGIGGMGLDVIVSSMTMQNASTINVVMDATGDISYSFIYAGNLLITDSGSGIFVDTISSGLVPAGEVYIQGGNITLDNGAVISSTTATDGDAGIISLNASNINILNGSSIEASSTNNGNGGIISLGANGADSYEIPFYCSETHCSPGGGGYLINLVINNGSSIQASTSGAGNAGSIDINASGLIDISASNIESKNTNSNAGSAGSIILTSSNNINISNGAGVSVSTQSNNINNTPATLTIRAFNNLVLDGVALGVSDAGAITINAGVFNNTDSLITTGTTGDGNAGELIINTTEFNMFGGIIMSNSSIGSGNAGNIVINDQRTNSANTIELNDFTLREGGTIMAQTSGQGDAGNVVITANGTVSVGNDADTVAGNGIASNSYGVTSGSAGSISINAADLVMTKSAGINVSTESNNITNEKANIDFNILNTLSMNGLGVNIESDTAGASHAGNITISAGSINAGSGFIKATTSAQGNGGFINISANQIDINSIVTTTASAGSTGNAGDITLNANSITSRGIFGASTLGSGSGGDITISAVNDLVIQGGVLAGSGNEANPNAGSAGNIIINADNLRLGDFDTALGTLLLSSTVGTGNAGGISISVAGDMVVADSTGVLASSLSELPGAGMAGDVSVSAGGDITIQGRGVEDTLHNRFYPVFGTESFGDGGSGNLQVSAANLDLGDGATLSATTLGSGDAGNIIVDVTGALTIGHVTDTVAGTAIETRSEGVNSGSAGNITITAQQINMAGDSKVSASAESNDISNSIANVSLITTNSLSMQSGTSISTNTTGDVAAGSITINTGALSNIGGTISASTDGGSGDANAIVVNATSVTLDGGVIETTASATSTGNAGSVSLDQNTSDAIVLTDVSLTNNARISTSTAGTGDAGNVAITATNNIGVTGSTIESKSMGTTSGSAGSVTLSAANINLGAAGIINASTQSDVATNIAAVSITPATSLTMGTGSQITTSTTGDVAAGSITINTGALSNAGGTISASTDGGGNAGLVTINANTLTLSDGVISSSTDAAGNSGSIFLTGVDFNFINGGQVLTSTSSTGVGGVINANASNKIEISGADTNGNASGIFSNSTGVGASGNGGSITLQTADFSLIDGGTLSASSAGLGTAGDINVTASKTINLDGGIIKTVSEQSSGGNININAIEYIGLFNSLISSEANGDGGNISIDPVLLIMSNTDIIANANLGNGGNIDIVADNMVISGDTIIEASSSTGIDGEIIVESPNQYLGTDAEQETTFLDISSLMNNSCVAAQRQRSSFTTEERNYLYFTPDRYMPSSIENIIDRKQKYQKDQASVMF